MRKILILCLITALAAPIHAQEAEPYRIAFWSRLGLYTINDDGRDMRHLEFDPQQFDRLNSATWSPDGSRLLLMLIHYEDALAYLYMAEPDGSNMRLLLDDPVMYTADPRWSPDGSHIIFRDDLDGQRAIYMIDADGSHRRLVIESYTDVPVPTWSPDGTRLAFLTGYIDRLNISVLDLETGQSPELVHELTDGLYKWSPAGDYIAFHHWDGSDDIYTVSVETGEITQLLTDDEENLSDEYFFNWSPDGTRIAVTSNRSGVSQVYTMNPDGSDIRQITGEVSGASLNAYSPDGKWITYRAQREVWVMHPDGSEARQLTFDEEDQEFVQWSPDGDEIMLLHYGDSHRIRIVDIVAGDFRDLPAPPGDVFSPQWIP